MTRTKNSLRFVDMTRRDMREWLRKTVDQEKDVSQLEYCTIVLS